MCTHHRSLRTKKCFYVVFDIHLYLGALPMRRCEIRTRLERLIWQGDVSNVAVDWFCQYKGSMAFKEVSWSDVSDCLWSCLTFSVCILFLRNFFIVRPIMSLNGSPLLIRWQILMLKHSLNHRQWGHGVHIHRISWQICCSAHCCGTQWAWMTTPIPWRYSPQAASCPISLIQVSIKRLRLSLGSNLYVRHQSQTGIERASTWPAVP